MIFGDFEANIPLSTLDSSLSGGELASTEGSAPTLDALLVKIGFDGRSSTPDREMLAERPDALIMDLWLSAGVLEARRGSMGAVEAPTPLRELDEGELALLAGDWWSLIPEDIPPWPGGPPDDGGGGGGWGGGGGQSDPVAEETPCVEASPADAPLQEINNKALAASNAIAALNDETFEYSSIVWALNGVVGYTDPFTNGYTDEVNSLGGIAQVPTGAVIVGIVHNHPDEPGINDRIPSGAGQENGVDWSAFDDIINYNRDHATDLPRNITVSPNMLMYIYTNEDHKTRVYDKTDKNQTNASCALQN